MANRIKGIIVEIGGDTVGLQKALKDVNDKAKNVSSEMREVEKALKLDPSNTELLAQKHTLLSKQVEIAKEKLSALKDVQKQVEQQFKNGDIGEEQYRAFQREVALAESNVKRLDGQLEEVEKTMNITSESTEELSKDLDNAGKTTKDLGENVEQSESKLAKFGEVAKNIGKVAADIFVALGKAAIDTGKKIWEMSNDVASAGDAIDKTSQKIGISAESYQEWGYVFERCGANVDNLQAGMKTLRTAMDNVRDSATGGTVDTDKLNKAQTKYKNAVLDLEKAQITYNVAIQKSGENSDAAKKAFLDLQKAQNKVTDAENSYISAQQGTTPTLSEAGKALKELGVETSTTSGELRSEEEVFADTITALQSMTNETERARYASLIFGKSGTELAALLNTSAADTQALKDEAHEYGMIMSNEAVAASATFEDSLTKLNHTIDGLKNNMIGALLPSITLIMDSLTDLIAGKENAGQAMDEAMTSLGNTLNNGLSEIVKKVPMFLSAAKTLILSLVKGIIDNLPEIVKAALEVVVELAKGIVDALPELLPALIECIATITDTLTSPSMLSEILDTALNLLITLADGLIDAIPQLIDATIQIIENLIRFFFFFQNISKLVNAGIRVTMALQTGLLNALPKLAEGALKLVLAIGDTIVHTDWLQVGKNIVDGLWDGLKRSWGSLQEWFNNAVNGLVDGIKGWLGIHSPSKVFAGIGDFMALGLGEGFTKSMTAVNKDIANAIPTDFDIEPTINGSAPQKAFNGNTQTESKIVFMMNIENFYNQNKQDLDEIMEYAGDYFSAQMERRGVMF